MNIEKINQNLTTRLGIQSLQQLLEQQEGSFGSDNDVCPLKHSFADGCYVREIFIPKGTVVVGKIHKHSHPNFLMKGKVIVITESGRKEICAPCSMISDAGTKRAVLAVEDTVWITVHVTKETELEKIEEEIIAKDYREIGLQDPMLDLIEKELICHG